MLIPENPEVRPELLENAIQQLEGSSDRILIWDNPSDTDAINVATKSLSANMLANLANDIRSADYARLSQSHGRPVPPYFAGDISDKSFTLAIYVAFAADENDVRKKDVSSDMRTLGELLHFEKYLTARLPSQFLRQYGFEGATNDWTALSIQQLLDFPIT